jgi:ParB family chromosome partitioning protein
MQMELTHIPLEQLKLSPLNVRSKGGKDIADLLPSIRSLGIIQPLLVRPNCEGFEIVAGQRRYLALTKLAEEGIAEAVPVIVMDEGDDAKAIEASLAENVARLPMDEIDQYKAFAAMKAEGLDVAEIASRFGVTERLVDQRLAIAGIIEPILNAYRREEIRPDTLRILTMGTQRQQKAWWKLFKSVEEYAPVGNALREWLFGGSQIPTANARFDAAQYKGGIVSDLFGEGSYFADVQAFWPLQNAAIADKRDAYLANRWSEVVILDVGQRFSPWSHVKTPKTKGGKVFVAIGHDGEVAFHEGWLTEKESKRREKAGTSGTDAATDGEAAIAARPELTKAMCNYLGLLKHAAIRTELLARPGIALRLIVAHIIAGSGLWNVRAEEQRAHSEAIGMSLAASKAEAGFAEERGRISALLGFENDADMPIVRREFGMRRDPGSIFERLAELTDKDVMRILAFVMAETLDAHTPLIDTLGGLFSTDMRLWWSPDETFFDLLRDKEAINAMVREVAGDTTADAHISSKAKVQKKIVRDCLTGEGRESVEGWLPRCLTFPATGYTSRFRGQTDTVPVELDGDDAE